MLQIHEIIGSKQDTNLSNLLHDLSHDNKVEYIVLDHANLQRRKFRAKTDQGTDCAISISRDQKLYNGAILYLDKNCAIVVKMANDEWLTLKPKDLATAIELGYFAGNMHWRVKFESDCLSIALESPKEVYLDRLKDFFSKNKIIQINVD